VANGTKTKEEIVLLVRNYFDEAYDAKRDRMDLNRLNFDCFHLRSSYFHKVEGQSQEFLGKVNLAVEQISAFIQQGLIDIGDWFRVDTAPGIAPEALTISPEDVRRLTKRQLELVGFNTKVSDALKLGLLGSLMIAKVHGKFVNKPQFIVRDEVDGINIKKRLVEKENKVWQLCIDLVRQEDWYPDPTGRGLYEIQRIEMDYYKLLELAKMPGSTYDLEAVKSLQPSSGLLSERERDKHTETAQNTTEGGSKRSTIVLDEFWGNIVDPTTGELLYENIVATVADEKTLIQKPTPNPLWHQKSPFVVTPIERVPNSVWHKAVMDAPTRHNMAMNELYNLMVDGAMMGVHGIKQYRPEWLDDPEQISGGIPPGTSLAVTQAMPPGAQVLERVDTSSVPAEALNMYNAMSSEFNQSAFTNDLRLGVLPSRSVKATEVVEASQSITGVFAGLAKNIEVSFIEAVVERSWMTIAQHMNDLHFEDVKAILGPRADLVQSISPEERFAETVNGLKFRVFGITRTLNKIKEFRKIQGLLQTIGSSEILMQAFSQKFDFNKLLDEVMKSLDINTEKLQLDEAEIAAGPEPQGGPDMQSNIPQAGAAVNERVEEEGGIPKPDFPPSRATGGG